MSGIQMNSDAKSAFVELKTGHKFPFLLLRMDPKYREIQVEERLDCSFDELAGKLPEKDCRYIIMEVPNTKKLVFVLWAPEDSPVKSRMCYATTKPATLASLDGCQRSVDISDKEDFSMETLNSLIK
eukprot:Trichotokara_eunicae@DN5895_c0_g1_i1.p1